MTYQTIELEHRSNSAFIWLNRPDVRNAFDERTVAELTDAVQTSATDTSVRAVVLAARGKAFCAGADLGWMQRMAGYSREENIADAQALARMLHAVYMCPKPTVARVQGDCYAGGIGLAAACDIAIAVRAAMFSLSETRLGLIPATVGPYVLRAMGVRAASRYMLTAERFDALEAHRIGLVHAITSSDDLDRDIEELLDRLSMASPNALQAAKRLIRDLAHRSVDEELARHTAELIAEARSSEDGREGVEAFLAKRQPRWACSPKS
jgi:methylglutaconyl-CoA hydratase